MTGRSLPPTSRFAADDGVADPALAAALAACVAGSGSVADVVAALAGARVLVPVVAGADAGTGHGWAAAIAVAAPDGRAAMPVFSSVAALTAWRVDARPVPVEGPRAAAAAVAEGWDLLVIDPRTAGVVVPRPAVVALASGTAWQPAVRGGRVSAEAATAVLRALDDVADLAAVEAVPGRNAEVAVLLTVRPGLSRTELDALVTAVSDRLAAQVSDLVDSLELRVSGGDAG